MPKAKVNDIQMYYEVKGEGHPVIMICGMNQNMEMWDPRLVEGLLKHFKLVLFDNRGAGRTDTSDKEYTISCLADDAAGLMNAIGISKAHILGLSMGGIIAQELAINHPEKVSKLVLCSTISQWRPTHEDFRMMEALISQSSMEELTKMILSFPFTRDYPRDFLKENPFCTGFTSEFVKENPKLAKSLLQLGTQYPISPESWRYRYSAILGFNTQTRLQQIKAPTLVMHGRKDTTVPPENGSILAEAIPNAKLVYLEKSAHLLAEEMSEVIKIVTEFLL